MGKLPTMCDALQQMGSEYLATAMDGILGVVAMGLAFYGAATTADLWCESFSKWGIYACCAGAVLANIYKAGIMYANNWSVDGIWDKTFKSAAAELGSASAVAALAIKQVADSNTAQVIASCSTDGVDL